jgi:hypothetical protein
MVHLFGKAAVVLGGMITLGACKGGEPATTLSGSESIVSSASPLAVSITPRPIALTPIPVSHGIGCQTFAARFDLTVHNGGGSDLFFNAATFHFLDGSTRSASPMLMGAGNLTNRFGHLWIRRGITRVFKFDERLTCDSLEAPRFLRADVILIDVRGRARAIAVDAPATLTSIGTPK